MVCLNNETSKNMLVKGTTIWDLIKMKKTPHDFIITFVKKQTKTDDFEIESCQSVLFKL